MPDESPGRPPPTDRVFLEGARFQVHVGVTEEERESAQELVIDLVWEAATDSAARSDDIADAINYDTVQTRVQGLIEPRNFQLIETVAEVIAWALLAEFPMESVTVTVRKPGALRARGVDTVGIEITRRKESAAETEPESGVESA